jgi:hypothetical protein
LLLDRMTIAALFLAVLAAVLAATAPGLGPGPTWAIALVLAIGLGFALQGRWQRILVFALVPVSLVTGSALVPADGRYVPIVVTLGAMVVANRADLSASVGSVRRLPPSLLVVLASYLFWAAVTTATSSEKAISIQYLVGLLLSLGCGLVIAPAVVHRDGIGRQFLVVIAATGLVLLVAGWVLVLVRGIDLFGRAVGVYFIEELTIFGTRTGLVFPQNYGPFVGPSTEPLALGVVAAVYLASTSRGRERIVWLVTIIVIIVGLVTTFSREGLLMAAIGLGGLAVFELRQRRLHVPTAAAALLLGCIFVAAMVEVVSVVGRLDLTASWYGAEGVAVLMNPDHVHRGETPASSGSPQPTPSGGLGGTGSLPTQPVATTSPSFPAVVDLKTVSSLDARLSLWSAAAKATAKSPIVGYGLGTDADAIIPYLTGEDARLSGVTTHSTFFRIAVEMGLPGLAIQIALTVISVFLAARAILFRSSGVNAVIAGCLLALLAHEVAGTLLLGGLSYANVLLVLTVGILAWPDRDSAERPSLAGSPAVRSGALAS